MAVKNSGGFPASRALGRTVKAGTRFFKLIPKSGQRAVNPGTPLTNSPQVPKHPIDAGRTF